MKRNLIFLVFSMLISISALSQTSWLWIHGQVFNEQTNAGQANQLVYFSIIDSIAGSVYDSTYTYADGYYESDTIYTLTTQGVIEISTTDPCSGNMLNEYQFFPPGPGIEQNFNICAQSPTGCENYFTYDAQSDSLTFVFEGFVNVNDPTTYSWDFGDGSTGTGQTITHTFVPQGTSMFQVCLTTESTDSLNNICTAISCQDVYIYGQQDCDAFYTAASMPGSPMVWQFNDMSVGGGQMSWNWDFGDGTYSYEQNPMHTFSQSGTYEVCLTVIDSLDSCVDDYCEFIIVSGNTGGDCENDFTYTSSDMLTFEFSGFMVDPALQADSYFWDFGDGTTATGPNVTYTFSPGGAAFFSVCLTTWTWLNNDSCYYTSCQDVYIQPAGNCVSGYVYIDSSQFVDEAFVHLMTYDSLNNTLILETTSVNNNGYYLFDNVAPGNAYTYYVQAVLGPQSMYFGQYVPTYHYDAITWNDAYTVNPQPCQGNLLYDIMMQEDIDAAGGQGNINGVVYSEDKKGIMADMELLLFNDQMQALGYLYTNDWGLFDFSDLAWGTYYIFPEQVGIETDGFMVELSESNPEQNMIIIVGDNSAFLSVEDYNIITHLGDLYPNPVKSQLSLELSLESAARIEIFIYNQMGQVIMSYPETLDAGHNRIELNTSGLTEGIYNMRLQAPNSKALMKRFIKVD